jgi:hypothetical protein
VGEKVLEANLPVFRLVFLGVALKPGPGVELRLQVQLRDGSDHTAHRWLCPSGAPSPGQVEDFTAMIGQYVTVEVLETLGVQGRLDI